MKNNIPFFVAFIFLSCGGDDHVCNCNIPEISDVKRGVEKFNNQNSWEIKPGGEIEADIKKTVSTKIDISGGYADINSNFQEIYTEILSSNPDLTQKANLYRVIALSFCEQICQDRTLTDSSRAQKQLLVLYNFERNITKIIDQENGVDTLHNPNPGESRDSHNESNASHPDTIPLPIKIVN